MKKNSIILIGAFFLLTLGGCTVAKVNTKGSVPIVMNQPDQKTTVIKSFKEKERNVFDWTNSYEMTGITNKVVSATQADALANVEFKIKYRISDYFINVLTLGLARSSTIEVTGDAVKYNEVQAETQTKK